MIEIKYLPTGTVTKITNGHVVSYTQAEWIEHQQESWWSNALKTIKRICTEK